MDLSTERANCRAPPRIARGRDDRQICKVSGFADTAAHARPHLNERRQPPGDGLHKNSRTPFNNLSEPAPETAAK